MSASGNASRDLERTRFRRRGDAWAVGAGVTIIVIVVVAGLSDDSRAVPATAVIIGPLVTAMLGQRLATMFVGVLAVAGAVIIAVGDGLSLTGEVPFRLIVVVAGSAAAVGLASLRLRREEALVALDQAHDADLRSLFAASAVPMMLLAADGHIADANDAMVELIGVPRGDLLGTEAGSRVHPDDRDPAARADVLNGRAATWGGDVRVRDAEGSWRWVRMTASHLHGRDTTAGRVLVQLVDITERYSAERRLHEEARRDPLTGLPNRRAMSGDLARAVAESAGTLGVLFVDLDRFKQINDTYGHSVGDDVLVHAAQRLRGAIRPGDEVYRYAGDEFVVVCRRCASSGELTGVGQRLVDVFATPIATSIGSVLLGASVGGVATPTPARCEADELLNAADAALYEAKTSGGSCVSVREVIPRD